MKKVIFILVTALALSIGANAAFEKVNTYSGQFSDVPDTAWYAENVKTAYELGFMNGKSEGKFDPAGNVTVVEGLTMASRLHAIYNGGEVSDYKRTVESFTLGFSDSENIVDLTEKNSRNDAGISFKRANGRIEDGLLVIQSDAPNERGLYDPQVTINGISLAADDYNKIKIRMKIEPLENTNPDTPRNETIQIYFKTSTSPSIAADKCLELKLKTLGTDLTDWFEAEIDAGSHTLWTDYITGIRFDPSNDNGIFYVDYISFEKDETAEGAAPKWYDMYVNYAVDMGIVAKDTFTAEEYSRNITRAEICDLFAAAIPEDYFTAVNEVTGIPDVLRDRKNADIYLLLYRAGILLGADSEGNFKPDADIKRSEIAAIINRVALPENRVKGKVTFDWAKQGNEYDVEFDGDVIPDSVIVGDADSAVVENGALVLVSSDRGEERKPRFDPKITVKNINIDAEEYAKLKVRMKIEYLGNIERTDFDFFFKTEGDTAFSEAKALHQELSACSYLDPAGWYVLEVDFGLHKEWKGNITEFRFDPGNTNGIYTIDYIRLAKSNPLQGASHEVLLGEGYTATRLMQDEHFERGFYVAKTDQSAGYLNHGIWQDYCENAEKPLWGIGPWWIGTGDGFTTVDLWEERDTTADKYTLTDKYGINTIKYNPDEKSITMRQNATKIYNGAPHIAENYKWWPHLLLEQNSTVCDFDKVRNSASADRMFFEIDVRMNDYKKTTNEDGENFASFLVYYYLMTDKAPGQRIWFGLKLFAGDAGYDLVSASWAPDSAAHQYMYGIPQAEIFDGIENTFNPEKGKVVSDGVWKHVRLDVTEHIDRVVEWANRDNVFGVKVTKEDMYFGGVNIGFETHGNYDYEFEFKNFNMIAYNSAE